MLSQLEQMLQKNRSEEDSIFYHHSSEERIVLSHALFWVMTQSLKGNIAKEKYLMLLRQYEEEMLDAFLMENDSFADLLHYCNILYESLPTILAGTRHLITDKEACRLAAITVVASGYAGDMPEDMSDELLDDMDFGHNKVKCRKIEEMLPLLNKMVEDEMKAMVG